MTVAEFLQGMFGSRAIEIAAVLCGLANVTLIIRRSIWNYPFGFIMVTLYACVFYESKLYSDALLQIYFFIIQIFGLIWWLQKTDDAGLVSVRNLPVPVMLMWVCTALLLTAILGFVMSSQTDAALPYWDAAITVLSVLAQALMAQRYVQSWLVWITVDLLAVGVFLAKDLTPTAVLYAIFLGLAVQGWFTWRASTRSSEAARV